MSILKQERASEEAVISWDFPEPKNGLDRFIGPGATRTELILQFVPPVVAAVALAVFAVLLEWGWSAIQIVLLAVLAADAIGGVITNATGAAKRWYHRRGQTPAKHFLFVASHGLQLLLVKLVVADIGWSFFFVSYGYLFVAAGVILMTPVYVQRPVALLVFSIGMLVSLYGVAVPIELIWFLPVFYLKLFVSHLVHEEPYRPATPAVATFTTTEGKEVMGLTPECR